MALSIQKPERYDLVLNWIKESNLPLRRYELPQGAYVVAPTILEAMALTGLIGEKHFSQGVPTNESAGVYEVQWSV